MSKYTPGPWHVGGSDKSTIYNKYGQRIANSFEGVLVTQASDETCQSNARLIAAAPDLLEVLQEMVAGDAQAIEEAEALGVPFPEEMLTAYRKAVAAIAKATGEKA